MNEAERTSCKIVSRTALQTAWWHRIGVLCLVCCAAAMPLRAQTDLTLLYSFCYLESYCEPPTTHGARPYAGLVQGLDGNFYGTAEAGGSTTCDGGCGTVFMITPVGALTNLYSFCSLTNCADGAVPYAGLTLGTDGNFYGTTVYGGSYGGNQSGGTVFKITPGGTLTTLHSFCQMSDCTDGEEPYGGLVQGTDGNFYGTTTFGGAAGDGMVFKITPAGTLTTLYNFCSLAGCADGANPYDALVQGTDGNFYGTTKSGGPQETKGTTFEMNPRGPMIALSNPSCSQNCGYGDQPYAGFVQATNGNLYLTVTSGGGDDDGTVLQMTPTGTVTLLHTFTGGTDGNSPYDPLIQASDGNLYGTTYSGSTNNSGTVFEITTGGTLTTLYSFGVVSGGGNGANPESPLLQATSGTFYGTTTGGGSIGWGAIFSLTNGLGPFVTTLPSFGLVGSTVDILGTDLSSATSVTFNGTPATFEIASDSEIVVTVPAGATTGKIEVVTSSGTLTSNVNFRVRPPVTAMGLTTNFDGGAAGDLTLWRPDTTTWYVKPASGAPVKTVLEGLPGDLPVTGDFDGDGKSDYGLWRPSNGTWYIILSSTGKMIMQQWGVSGDIPVASDYDGDGKTDFAIWRPSNATFYVIPSGGGPDIIKQWGAVSDVPVIGDYDGDGKADFATWRPSTGTWYVSLSGGGTLTQPWGIPGDIPVESDYDGDGMTDYAVWRPSNGTWYIMLSSTGKMVEQQWGILGDIPVVGDYNNDGKADYAVFRPSNATWYVTYSSGGESTTQWGATGDIPATHLASVIRRDRHIANFDGDRKTDMAVWRPSTGTWWVIDSSTGLYTQQLWGLSGDIIVPGDYDGDGKTDYAIFRPSTGTWWVLLSSTGKIVTQPFGMSGDIPVPGDYDGDGKTDYAIWRPSTGTWWVLLSSTGKTVSQPLGISGDIPVPADYDGDGKTDYAVWRPSSGTWYLIDSSTGLSVNQVWGKSGDIPVPGDYDGDMRADYTVFRPSNGTWYTIESSTGSIITTPFGQNGDIPVAKDYDGDEKTDIAIWRPSTATWYILQSSNGQWVIKQWGASTDVPVNEPTGY